jgi:lipopolysaccharide/colanic/teichoic acid biosynthesis glycosyltransferase
MPELITLALGNYGVKGSAEPVNQKPFDITKRGMDIILGFLALILLFPVMVLCGIIIKLSSKGPVFYKQVRMGKGGKLFEMYKLRTMYDDAEAKTGAVWASDNDPRVVWACRWMRRGHFDELPQLVNVLKGEMSLVGPRPERPEIIEKLENIYPNIHRRLAVRPGITGLAQIRNGYDKTIESTCRKLEADVEYIRSRGLGQELLILAATLPKFYDKAAH